MCPYSPIEFIKFITSYVHVRLQQMKDESSIYFIECDSIPRNPLKCRTFPAKWNSSNETSQKLELSNSLISELYTISHR
jgi:hypothetical protein